MRHLDKITAVGVAAAVMTTALVSGPAASAQSDDNRQKDKNTMRSLGIGLGAAAVLQALQGKGTGALLLGAGAAYAGKRYEDDRKAQQQDDQDRNRRYGYRDNRNNNDDNRRDRRDSSYDRASYQSRGQSGRMGMASSNSMAAPAVAPIDVYVNGRQVDFSDQGPEMTAGNVYVPMRGVLEKIGASVQWDAQDRSVVAMDGGKTVRLPVNGMASVNGREMALDTPAYIQDGRTMVPLRFLAQTFGAQVNWDAPNHTVNIDTNNSVSMVR